MLDILTTQTSSQQMGKSAQSKKVDNADAQEQAFAEEYAATGAEVEGTEQQTEEPEVASQEQSDGETDAEASDETSSDGLSRPDLENSATTVDEQPVFGVADSGKAAKVPEGDASPSTAELSKTRRPTVQDLAQVTPADATKQSDSAGAAKTVGSTVSAAEVFVSAKAAENAAMATSAGLAEQPAKGVGTDLPSLNVPLVKQEKTPVSAVKTLNPSDQLPEKIKSMELSEELLARAVTSRSDAQSQTVAPTPPAAQQVAKIVPLTALAKVESSKDKTVLDSTSALNIEALTATEVRSSSSTATTPLQQLLGRAETPAAIARQMAEALQKLPDRPVEISLNPKELGRVRMNISAAEAGITVSIVTERPETLDLMRRNIDQLVREFQAIGYSDINFAFSEGETQQGFGEASDERSEGTTSQLELLEAEQIADSNETNLLAQIGVDIRL